MSMPTAPTHVEQAPPPVPVEHRNNNAFNMPQFWYHIIPFALLGIFSLTELGLTGDWIKAALFRNGRVGFALFVSIWTVLSLLIHWTFPFIIAAAWAAFTALLWLIAGAVLASASCTTVNAGFGRQIRVCFKGYGKWDAMVAFAFINFILLLASLACIWYYVIMSKKATWRDGIYGRNYYLKPRAHGVRGETVGMKEVNFKQPGAA